MTEQAQEGNGFITISRSATAFPDNWWFICFVWKSVSQVENGVAAAGCVRVSSDPNAENETRIFDSTPSLHQSHHDAPKCTKVSFHSMTKHFIVASRNEKNFVRFGSKRPGII